MIHTLKLIGDILITVAFGCLGAVLLYLFRFRVKKRAFVLMTVMGISGFVNHLLEMLISFSKWKDFGMWGSINRIIFGLSLFLITFELPTLIRLVTEDRRKILQELVGLRQYIQSANVLLRKVMRIQNRIESHDSS